MKYTSFKYWIFFFILGVLSVVHVQGQELYQFKGATVIIEFDYGDSIVQLQSKHLHVLLDNDNAEFISKLEIGTLINIQNGYRPKIKFASDNDKIVMVGKFKVDHIETSNHAPLNFEFSGLLTQNKVAVPIYGLAELQHIGGGGSISCMLGYSFIIDEQTLRLNNIGKENLRQVKVQVLQTILNKDAQY